MSIEKRIEKLERTVSDRQAKPDLWAHVTPECADELKACAMAYWEKFPCNCLEMRKPEPESLAEKAHYWLWPIRCAYVDVVMERVSVEDIRAVDDLKLRPLITLLDDFSSLGRLSPI